MFTYFEETLNSNLYEQYRQDIYCITNYNSYAQSFQNRTLTNILSTFSIKAKKH